MAVKVWRGDDGVFLDFGDAKVSVSASDVINIIAVLQAEFRLSAHYQRWSDAEDDELQRLYAQGEKAASIARALNRSAASVATRVSNLGLAARNPAVSASNRRRSHAEAAQ